jgi:hypothetical protein
MQLLFAWPPKCEELCTDSTEVTQDTPWRVFLADQCNKLCHAVQMYKKHRSYQFEKVVKSAAVKKSDILDSGPALYTCIIMPLFLNF